MKIKAKETYLELTDEKNFISLNSASTHLKLKAGEEVEWDGKVSKSLMAHLTKVKEGSK